MNEPAELHIHPVDDQHPHHHRLPVLRSAQQLILDDRHPGVIPSPDFIAKPALLIQLGLFIRHFTRFYPYREQIQHLAQTAAYTMCDLSGIIISGIINHSRMWNHGDNSGTQLFTGLLLSNPPSPFL